MRILPLNELAPFPEFLKIWFLQQAPPHIQGLTDEQVQTARHQYGYNRIEAPSDNRLLKALKSLAGEPMVILLLAASLIYFISGNYSDGLFMVSAIVLVSAISLYQDARSRHALQRLREFIRPTCRVIRNGQVISVKCEEIVPGDSIMVEEGTAVPADGSIVHANDFSVNESILTGESLPVYKDAAQADNRIYSGTTIASGLAIATVTATGNNTRLAQIGKSVQTIPEEKTPLEIQLKDFVKKMAAVGVVVFIIVWLINFFRSGVLLDSLLKALTLAMSILPEEIPVAFTTFMALGAWRLMQAGIVVKQMKTVETLGSATVICTDKTGTITENKMALARLYLPSSHQIIDAESQTLSDEAKALIRMAMWASEPIPFDAMEVALHQAYSGTAVTDERKQYRLFHEYPLSGKPPMMTHLFQNEAGERIIAAKGSPEAMIAVSELTPDQQANIQAAISELASEGYRVLGVGESRFEGNDFPEQQQLLRFRFAGLVAFYDPPKKDIAAVFNSFYKAGITVKIVTGDYAATTLAIARKAGFRGLDNYLTGDEVMQLSEADLQQQAGQCQIYTRMFPEAKLKLIQALKADQQIVAMTGDGVNDGPALKAAHIGIAMGQRGTEIAKEASSLILMEDSLSKMVEAIAMGRKIYANLKKAIQYIISIHIPIILIVFVPLALGWLYPNIFSPIHIIFMELIMGPTCSIIYENEPLEPDSMQQPPRPFTTTFFKWRELTTSIIQGLVIALCCLLIYQFAVRQGLNEATTRTMVFTTLICANIFLTLVNRSFYYSVFTTLQYPNRLVPLIIAITVLLSAALLLIGPITRFFEFERLSFYQLIVSLCAGFVSVVWVELVKKKPAHSRS